MFHSLFSDACHFSSVLHNPLYFLSPLKVEPVTQWQCWVGLAVLRTQLSMYKLHAGYTQWGPVCLVQRIQGEGDVEETEQIFPRLTNDQVLIISLYTLGNVVKNLGFLFGLWRNISKLFSKSIISIVSKLHETNKQMKADCSFDSLTYGIQLFQGFLKNIQSLNRQKVSGFASLSPEIYSKSLEVFSLSAPGSVSKEVRVVSATREKLED